MASVCDVCGKGPGFGMSVSHSHRRTHRRWNPNVQRVRAHRRARHPSADHRVHVLPEGRQGRPRLAPQLSAFVRHALTARLLPEEAGCSRSCDDHLVLIGRDHETAELARLLADDRAVVVVGEAGVGKTALLRAVAEASGRRVAEGGALATLSWMDYLPLQRALGRPVREGDAVAVAVDVEAELGDAVLVLDDLHWADTATLEVTGQLAGRVGLLAGCPARPSRRPTRCSTGCATRASSRSRSPRSRQSSPST